MVFIDDATSELMHLEMVESESTFFVYDRIITDPDHRRRGLGRALMQTLHDARHNLSATELLVATEDGRTLYSALGWTTISPYSTASIVSP